MAEVEPVPIVLLIGQSNMQLEALPLGAAQEIAQSGGIVLHYAVSGSPLDSSLDMGTGDWSAQDTPEAGENLDLLIESIYAFTDPSSEQYIPGAYLAGAIWVQGEADSASSDAAANYYDNLVALQNELVNEFGEHEWVVAALSENVWDLRSYGTQRMENWLAVRDAQLQVDALDGFTTIDTDALAAQLGYETDDMFRDDFVHYETDFASELGAALASQLDLNGPQVALVGTLGGDHLVVEDTSIRQVFGSKGTDAADFSNIDEAIMLRISESGDAYVTGRTGASELQVDLDGIERVYGTDHDDVFWTGKYTREIRAGDGDDLAIGGEYNDVFRLGDGNDVGKGNDGDDFLHGGWGDDLLAGGDGNDRLYGSAGNDKLLGGRGDDLLVGGNGNDEIRPHAGDDTILYTRGNNGADDIYGFNPNHDLVSFENSGVTQNDVSLLIDGKNLLLVVDTETTSANIEMHGMARRYDEDVEVDDLDWLIF